MIIGLIIMEISKKATTQVRSQLFSCVLKFSLKRDTLHDHKTTYFKDSSKFDILNWSYYCIIYFSEIIFTVSKYMFIKFTYIKCVFWFYRTTPCIIPDAIEWFPPFTQVTPIGNHKSV